MNFRLYNREIISGLILIFGLIADHFGLFNGIVGSGFNWMSFVIYLIAILPVGLPVVLEMFEHWRERSVMNEYTLMVAASIGAFIIGEYPEGVAVLLFYSFGEKLEDSASDDVRARIRSLLNQLPDKVNVIDENRGEYAAKPETVEPGTRIKVLPGERVPLDSRFTGDSSVEFDTSAITGESVPRSFNPGEELPSGIIPIDRAIECVSLRAYSESSMSRILEMIEKAQSEKSKTEGLLRRITKWYTPVVFLLAVLVFLIPLIVSGLQGEHFLWMKWLRRSLVFLVCSCPCALVVSVPLSYFVSLGTASRLGLLFKGSKYIDAMRNVKSIVFDKTGTLTTGKFHVSAIVPAPGYRESDVLKYATAIDSESTHPLAQAIVEYVSGTGITLPEAKDVRSICHGMSGKVEGHAVLVGSLKLMQMTGIRVPSGGHPGTEICVAVDCKYIGSIYLEDTIKEEAPGVIKELHESGVGNIMILSGDRKEAVERVASNIGANDYRSELLPEDKQRIVADLKGNGKVAFVGDGINDAPAISVADVGIAMGTMGTGMAMESADIVIAGDNLSKLPLAIRLARKVQSTVAQNVSFAIGVKVLVMVLGTFGIATLWGAVFADTGVTLVTILWTLLRLRKL